MSHYRLRLAFVRDNDDDLMPTLIAAVDEYTEDAWGGIPDFYTDECKKYGGAVREMIVLLPQEAVKALYEAPTIEAEVK